MISALGRIFLIAAFIAGHCSPARSAEIEESKGIRQVIGNYFTLIGKKDLERAMGLWHAEAPDREDQKKTLAAIFAQTGPLSTERVNVLRLWRDGESVRCEVEAIVRGMNSKTQQPDPRLGQFILVVEMVKRGDRWALWKSRDFVDYYITLYSKEIPDKRKRLKWLERNRGEAANLLMALNSGGLNVLGPGYSMKRRVELNALAFEVAEFVASVRDRGWCHFHRALLHMDAEEFPPALASLDLALADFRKDEHEEGEAVSSLFRGKVLVALEKAKEAVAAFEAAERLLRVLRITSIRDDQYYVAARMMYLWDDRDALSSQARQKWMENRPADALVDLEKMAGIERLLFGPKHWEIAATRNWRGSLYLELGRFDEAKREFAAAIELDTWLRGADADEVHSAQIAQKLVERFLALAPPQREEFWLGRRKHREAFLLSRKGDLVGSEQAIRKTIEIKKRLLGPDSTECEVASSFLAYVLAARNKYAEAAELHKRIEPGLLRDYGTNSALARAFVADRTKNLAMLFYYEHVNSRFESAQAACKELIDLLEREPARSDKNYDGTRAIMGGMLQHLKGVLALPAEKRTQFRNAITDTLVPPTLRQMDDASQLERLVRQMQVAREVVRELFGADDMFFMMCSFNFAEVCAQAKRWDECESTLKATLRNMERLRMQNTEIYAKNLALQGALARRRGDMAEAGPTILEAVAKLRVLQGPQGEYFLAALDALCSWYQQTGQIQRALDTCVEITRARKQLLLDNGKGGGRSATLMLEEGTTTPSGSDYREYVANLLRLADLQIHAQAPANSTERALRQAMAILRRTSGETSSRYATAVRGLATLRFLSGDLPEAKSLFLEAYQIVEQLPNPSADDTYQSLLPLGVIAQREGAYEEAEKIYRRLMAVAHGSYGPDHVLYVDALRLTTETLMPRGKLTEALKLEQERLGHEQAVIANAFSFASENLMQTFLGRVQGIDNLLSLAVAEGLPKPETIEMLWNWVLRRRGLVFESYCAFRDAQRASAADPEISKQLATARSLRNQIAQFDVDPPAGISPATLARQKQAARDEADRIEATIDRMLARTRPELIQTKTVAFAELGKRLAADTALIEFVRYHPRRFKAIEGKEPLYDPARYLVFVLLPGGVPPRLIDLGDAKAIDDGVDALRKAIVQYPDERKRGRLEATLESEFRTISSDLGRKLIEPLRESLRGKLTLLIAPDDRLHNLPFATLVDKDGKYLIETMRCRYLASGRDLLRPVPTALGEGVVVFADPDFDSLPGKRPPGKTPSDVLTTRGPPDELRGPGWKRLEGAAEEGEDLGKIISKGSFGPVRVLEGIKATKAELKVVRSPRILHFATHGFYFERRAKEDALTDWRLRVQENPLLRSGLVLAGANKWNEKLPDGTRREDGWVTAEEVSQFDLRGTDLVVLSACQTGLGDLKEGDGVYGLRRAFQYAGVRSLVTALFEVPDEPTHSLMKLFYERLVAGKGKLAALHESQLKLRDDRLKAVGSAHPFYWGGFILTGDP